MIHTMLVPTDGSDHAMKAVELAADIATKYGAELVILHVLLRNATAMEMLSLARAVGAPDGTVARLEQIEDVALDVRAIPYGYGGPMPVPVPDEVVLAVGEAVNAKAEAAARGKGVARVRSVTADAAPADAILYAAEQEKADMIVMGSRGLGRVADLLMGSVSHKVSHLAPCTCVTVK